jgi:AraC-like DNA-binding protein
MELVINLDGPGLSFYQSNRRHAIRAPLLAGAYSKCFQIDPAEYTAVIGVRFKPGTARLFFSIPAHELRDSDVPLADIDPQDASRLQDKLASSFDLSTRFAVLENYLLSRLSPGSALHPAVEYAVTEFSRRPGVRAIADVQAETGLSHTRFIQLFRENVGLTPKVFCRVQRFRSVVERIESGKPIHWAELATDCGYFDQAHLIHDFRAFSEMTPAAYLQDR